MYNHQSENGIVIFELETRVAARYILPCAVYKGLEIEGLDFLSYYLNDSGVREDRDRAGFPLPRSQLPRVSG